MADVHDETENAVLRFLQRKYVQHADDRQKAMGLSYITVGINDLAKEITRFMRATMPNGNTISHKSNVSKKVLHFTGITTEDIPVRQVLEEAIKADLSCVMVVGYTPEDNEYFATSMGDNAESLWLLERVKFDMLMPTTEAGRRD